MLTIMSFSCFSQTQNSKTLNNEIKKGVDIYSTISNDEISKIIAYGKLKEKSYVFFENKFYPVDTLKQIKNINDYSMEIIKIPVNISKDLSTIIVLKNRSNN